MVVVDVLLFWAATLFRLPGTGNYEDDPQEKRRRAKQQEQEASINLPKALATMTVILWTIASGQSTEVFLFELAAPSTRRLLRVDGVRLLRVARLGQGLTFPGAFDEFLGSGVGPVFRGGFAWILEGNLTGFWGGENLTVSSGI